MNEHRQTLVVPSERICGDESISRWYRFGGDWISIGNPYYVALDRSQKMVVKLRLLAEENLESRGLCKMGQQLRFASSSVGPALMELFALIQDFLLWKPRSSSWRGVCALLVSSKKLLVDIWWRTYPHWSGQHLGNMLLCYRKSGRKQRFNGFDVDRYIKAILSAPLELLHQDFPSSEIYGECLAMMPRVFIFSRPSLPHAKIYYDTCSIGTTSAVKMTST